MTYPERLYLTRAGEIVRGGNDAAELLGAVGQPVPPKWQARVKAFLESSPKPPQEIIDWGKQLAEQAPEVTTREPDIPHRDPPTRRRGRPPRGS